MIDLAIELRSLDEHPDSSGCSSLCHKTTQSEPLHALPPRILVVEDDPHLRSALRRTLWNAGLIVADSSDGIDAFELILNADVTFDIILLDLLLPGIDGRELCQRLRNAGVTTPIIMITALGEMDDRINGLQIGADDYLIKPINLTELLLRIGIILRRGIGPEHHYLEAGNIRMDLDSHEVSSGNRSLQLTLREYEILQYFLRRPGIVLSRRSIASAVWNAPKTVSPNLIDTHIARLRRKLEGGGQGSSIETVRGVGYRLSLESG
ncbi:MAG: response regulator transcription factor [Ferrimicrobium sp.]